MPLRCDTISLLERLKIDLHVEKDQKPRITMTMMTENLLIQLTEEMSQHETMVYTVSTPKDGVQSHEKSC